MRIIIGLITLATLGGCTTNWKGDIVKIGPLHQLNPEARPYDDGYRDNNGNLMPDYGYGTRPSRSTSNGTVVNEVK